MAIRKREIKDYIEPGHDQIRMKKGTQTTDSKASLIVKAGEDLTRNTGKWVYRELRKDRKNDLIEETIRDPQTGKLLYRSRGPLSEHRGHGSAKKKGEKSKKH